MRKTLRTLLALLLTAALILLARNALTPGKRAENEGVRMVRVWVTEKEPAVSAWLRSLATGYEKETGARVYLRLAAPEEAAAARRGEGSVIPPDVILAPCGAGQEALETEPDTTRAALWGTAEPGRGGQSASTDTRAAAMREDADPGRGGYSEAADTQIVALRGYALIVRDDAAILTTPAPTSSLFYHPTPTPGPRPSPAPAPDPASFAAVLAPEELLDALPGAVRSAHPVQDFLQGKAKAALLTAGQAAQLAFGYQAYPVPGGGGLLGVRAEALSADGQRFRAYLLREDAQRGLARFGLYSPALSLYSPEDALRFLIENSRVGE